MNSLAKRPSNRMNLGLMSEVNDPFRAKKQQLSNLNILTGLSYSQRYYEILKQRKTLPAWEAKEQLVEILKETNILILQGETGSGKTTQVPQFLIESGYVSG